MANIRNLIRSFNGGELTSEFFGQVESPSYQTGLATCRNFICFPHGPVGNRGGTKFVREVKDSTKKVNLIEFTFSTDQTLALEFGNEYIRFHAEGATLLQGTPAAYNGGTAYTPGDLVSSGGSNYVCIADTTGDTPPNATYWYAQPATGEYEIPSPYLATHVMTLHFVQSNDVLTIVHPEYEPRELRRNGASDWELRIVSFASPLSAPTNVSATATTGSGSTNYQYKVTAVDENNLESAPASSASSAITNDLTTAGYFNTITWTNVSGAERYNVYKLENGLYAFIGQSGDGTAGFIDDNIAPDLSKVEPLERTAFASADNYPTGVSYYEQRRVFGGTETEKQKVWMTRPGTESDLSYGIPAQPDDAIIFQVAARQSNTIQHIVPLSDLLILTTGAEWRVRSVSTDSIQPDSISVKPQSYIGANTVQPVVVSNNVIFASNRGGHIREMAFNETAGGYLTGDLCLRAPHLFDRYDIVDMGYAKSPYPMIWAISTSGNLLGLTYVPEEGVGPWHRHDTLNGTFESLCVIAEGLEDYVYVSVKRTIDGTTKRYIERLESRYFDDLEDAYFVDAGATYDNPFTITGATKANPVVITTGASHGLSNGDTIDIVKVEGMTELNGNRYTVANVTATTVELQDEDGADIDGTAYTTYTSGGELRKAITSISSGLDHLEGETVNILADGGVVDPRVVTNGEITLDRAASRIHVGLPITADLRTLPLAMQLEAFGQGRTKSVSKIYMRVERSSGIFAGPTFDKLRELKQRSDEAYGVAPRLLSEEIDLTLKADLNDTGQVCIRQTDPLPLIAVSLTTKVAIS